MLGANDEVLYVGKARRLDKRVQSYFRNTGISTKTQKLVAQIKRISIIITASENEALLLESNLIKQLKPRYNVLLRDDKSYPYIYISAHKNYPSLGFYRGAKRKQGDYYGPYPSVSAVRETLRLLQKTFKIRQCSDSFFRNRSRPCLQYQIKRCSAPCVDYISPQDYAQDLQHAKMLLTGRSQQLLKDLTQQMQQAAGSQHYEQAAQLRDQVISIRKIQEQQYVSGNGKDVDVIAVVKRAGKSCVHMLFIRDGRILGNKMFYPKSPAQATLEDILAAFIPQFYLTGQIQKSLPQKILLSHALTDKAWIAASLAEQFQRKVSLICPQRGAGKRWLEMALHNAEQALMTMLANQMNLQQSWEALQDELGLDALPQRMECFDISHTMGEATVASCVVFDSHGPVKSLYRRFNIKEITAGDDYAAMRQALTRRYTHLQQSEQTLPDLLVIDGGKGQLTQAIAVLEELQITDVVLLGVAKGVTRKPGLETLFLVIPGAKPKVVTLTPQALHLIQHIRDEAHRFAITGHRAKRGKKRRHSKLEDIPGVGARRRQALLQRFGGLQEILRASVAELAKTPGISRSLAQQIHDILHG